MNICRLLETPSLFTPCPFCGHADEDVWEVITQDSLHRLRCSDCKSHFHFAVMECGTCYADTVFAWEVAPSDAEFSGLACLACMKKYLQDEPPVLYSEAVA